MSADRQGRAVGHAVLTALCAFACLTVGYYTYVILVGLPSWQLLPCSPPAACHTP